MAGESQPATKHLWDWMDGATESVSPSLSPSRVLWGQVAGMLLSVALLAATVWGVLHQA